MANPQEPPTYAPFSIDQGQTINPIWLDWFLTQTTPAAGARGSAGQTGPAGATGPTGPSGPIDSNQILTWANPQVWDTNSGKLAFLTMTGSTTLNVPLNLVRGTYVLVVTQGGTGSYTMTYAAGYKWPGASAPVLSTAVGAIDILTFVSDGTSMFGVAQNAFA